MLAVLSSPVHVWSGHSCPLLLHLPLLLQLHFPSCPLVPLVVIALCKVKQRFVRIPCLAQLSQPEFVLTYSQ